MRMHNSARRDNLALRSLFRRTGTVVASLLALLLATSPAWAHNGVGAAFKGSAGSYTVYAYDGYFNPNGELEYRLVLLNRGTGQPVTSVNVSVSARPLRQPQVADRPVRASVQTLANVVLYDLPNPYPGDWTVRVAITGEAGAGVASFPMHGAAPVSATATTDPVVTVVSTGTSAATVGWIVAGGVIGVALVVVALLLRRRRAAGSV
jgi:hypothetical protein